MIGRIVAYDETRVQELAARPWVDENALMTACRWGVHVARLARGRAVDFGRPWKDVAADLAVQPALPAMTAVTHAARVQMSGGLPWVATVSGFVVFGAETTGWQPTDDGTIAFVLRPPGPWFGDLERRWFARGRGRHWFLWDPWRLQQ